MKQTFAGITLFLFLSLVGLLLYQATRPETLPIGGLLPALVYQGESGEAQLRASGERETVVVWFHSECSYCRHELDAMEAELPRLEAVRLYLLTSEDSLFRSGVRDRWPGLSGASGVTWGVVEGREFARRFGTAVVPANFVFARGGSLERRFRGETKLEALLPAGLPESSSAAASGRETTATAPGLGIGR